MRVIISGTLKNKDIFKNNINKKWFFRSKDTLEQLVDEIAGEVCVKIGRIPNCTCNIFLCNDTESIQRKYYEKVVHPSAPAFASLSRNAIIINASRCNRKILSHELGHIFFESFLNRRVGYDFHEYVAKHCES